MQDPWKYVAFPSSAILAYFVAVSGTETFRSYIGLSPFSARLILLAASGLLAGFLVDEVIPTYVENVRSGSSGGDIGGDMGGDMDAGGDFDLE